MFLFKVVIIPIGQINGRESLLIDDMYILLTLMVLISVGNSEIGAHECSEIVNLICITQLFR